MARFEGYLVCHTAGCPLKNVKTGLYGRRTVNKFFKRGAKLPNCPECGKSVALWDRRTQENLNKFFSLGG